MARPVSDVVNSGGGRDPNFTGSGNLTPRSSQVLQDKTSARPPLPTSSSSSNKDKEAYPNPRDSGRWDNAPNFRGSNAQLQARTPSPYMAGLKSSSVSKSEANIAARSGEDTPRADGLQRSAEVAQRTAVPSGCYSVTNGCLQHDTYPYTPPTYITNGGSKEDSTCSSNQVRPVNEWVEAIIIGFFQL
jgi:hypothetical protein